MQAIDRELLSVLGDSTIRFVVPVYQRSYAWQEEHWERLWDDILAIAGEQGKDACKGRASMPTAIFWLMVSSV